MHICIICPKPCHNKRGVIQMDNESRTGTANEPDYDYDVDIQSCSSMDCTGLIPSLPQSDAEIEHYNQLYKFMPDQTGDSKDRAK